MNGNTRAVTERFLKRHKGVDRDRLARELSVCLAAMKISKVAC